MRAVPRRVTSMLVAVLSLSTIIRWMRSRTSSAAPAVRPFRTPDPPTLSLGKRHRVVQRERTLGRLVIRLEHDGGLDRARGGKRASALTAISSPVGEVARKDADLPSNSRASRSIAAAWGFVPEAVVRAEHQRNEEH